MRPQQHKILAISCHGKEPMKGNAAQAGHLWVTVPLVDRRVCTQEVIVLPSFHVPDMNPLSFIQDDRKWSIVMCTIALLFVDVLKS